jgi:hypothetical protein
MRVGQSKLWALGAMCAGTLLAVSCGGGHGESGATSSQTSAVDNAIFDSCIAGDRESCQTYTDSFQLAETDKAGHQAADMCRRSSWHGCYFLKSADRDEVLVQYRNSCVQGSADPCIIAGFAVLATNEQVAFDLFERGCSQGADHESCTHIGESLCNGDGMTKNAELGAEFYEAACKRKDADACAKLGKMLMVGDGIERDEETAALVFATGRDQDRSESRAASLLSIACDRDDPSACRDLSELYRNSTDMSVDPAKADQLLDRACLLGSAGACDQQRKRQAEGAAATAIE